MGKERIVYNRHTMTDEIKIEENDYIDVVVEIVMVMLILLSLQKDVLVLYQPSQ